MTGIDRRGEAVALVGGLLSLLGAVIFAFLTIWGKSTAVWMAAFQMLGAAGIWLLTLIQLHQQRLVREERLEVAELDRLRREKLGGAQTIFEEEDLDQMEKLAMGRRLRTIERYLIPSMAILIALFHLVAGASVFPWRFQFPPIAAADPKELAAVAQVLVLFVGGMAFVCFMASRYALGMSRLQDWGALRAGGDFMFGSSAICLVTAVALLCVISGIGWVEILLARIIGVLLIVLAAETVINFVLDFYRPRIPGLQQRPFYDSRLLGIFSETGGILRSMANAVDYQFGFKVSETWFYKLLGQAVVPLVLVQVAIIFALTCFTVVPPGHKAVIEHNGLWDHVVWVAKPGVHFTWFWPVDRATLIPVERIQQMAIGYEVDEKQQEAELSGPILWTKKHYRKEYQLLVGDRRASADTKVPVNLLAINMPVQWRVKDNDREVVRFYDQSQDVPAIIESLAYRELTRYAAQADILDLLGEKGIQSAAELQNRLQNACDRAGYDDGGLGVQIVHVGIGGIHPPPDEDVAKSYEDVVSAYETRDAKIKAAEGDGAMLRIASAGADWQTLYDAIVLEDQTRENPSAQVGPQKDEVDRLLRSGGGLIGGSARQTAAEAEKQAVSRVFAEMSSSERYGMQLAAYNAAPRVYSLRVYLRMVEEGLQKVRKYVIALDDPERVIYRFDLRPPAEFDVTAAELGAMESKGGK